jgi:hypothetical protein
VVKYLEAMEENIDIECEVIYGGLRRPPVEFPIRRWEPVVRSDAAVRLPVDLEWSHKNQRVCDLAKPQQRVFAYKQILEHGAGRDICFWIDPDALLECYQDITIAPYAKDGLLRLVERLRERIDVAQSATLSRRNTPGPVLHYCANSLDRLTSTIYVNSAYNICELL